MFGWIMEMGWPVESNEYLQLYYYLKVSAVDLITVKTRRKEPFSVFFFCLHFI